MFSLEKKKEKKKEKGSFVRLNPHEKDGVEPDGSRCNDNLNLDKLTNVNKRYLEPTRFAPTILSNRNREQEKKKLEQ